MTTTRAIVSTESAATPLLSIYPLAGLVGRVELSPAAAPALAHNLIGLAVPKLTADTEAITSEALT